MILLIDDYDSSSYNLYQFVSTNYPDIRAVRNNELSAKQARELALSHIVLSPGPGYPGGADIYVEAAKELGQTIPLLDVYLEHQAICEAHGTTAFHVKQLMHDEQSVVTLDTDCPLFSELPKQIKAARYHSLAAIHGTMPEYLAVTAETDDGEIMAVMHHELPIYGVQFHPESTLTENGMQIIQNSLVLWKERLS